MFKSTQKANLTQNPIILDSDVFFIEQKGNKNFIYYSKEKCKSLEYVLDKLINELAIVIYEDLENNNIYIIKTHIDTESFEFNIDTINFNVKKVEDIINLTLFKTGINRIYFLDNSLLKSKINIRNAEIMQIEYKKIIQEIKKSPTLKTRNKYAFINFVVVIFLLLLNNGFNTLSLHLSSEKKKNFDIKHSELVQQVILQEKDIAKYTEIKNKKLKVLSNFEELNSSNMIISNQRGN